MSNNLKKEIEKDFDKEKNFATILSKIERVSSMKKFKIQYALIPICVIIIAVVGVSWTGIFKQNQEVEGQNSRWRIKKVYVDSLEETEDGMTVLPHWDDMAIVQQFSLLEFNGKQYDGKQGEVPDEMIGERLGTATLNGFDEYTDTTYTKNASIYAINTISRECAVAIQFEGTTEYYPYINAYYRPETLGDFINDLNLKELVSFGSIWYGDSYTDNEGNFHFDNIEFYDVDDEIIWSMLFSNISLENVHDDSSMLVPLMSVSVDIPVLGYKNISCWVTDDGYLVTNILDTGKAFYIGEDKVQEFVNYILNNYEGFKIVYVDEDGNEISDAIDEEINDNNGEQIVVMENNVVSSEIIITENDIEGGRNNTTERNVIASSEGVN